MAATTSYTVQGMTCGNCARHVGDAIGALVGVTGVDVDLAGGIVTVTSDAELDPGLIRAAVADAGYEFVS